MKIYSGKNKLRAKQTSLIDLLYNSLKELESGTFHVEKDRFSDNSSEWIEIKQIRGREAEVSVTISFDDCAPNITGISVYESKIKTIIDEENSKKII